MDKLISYIAFVTIYHEICSQYQTIWKEKLMFRRVPQITASDSRDQKEGSSRFLIWHLKVDFIVGIIMAVWYFSTHPFFSLDYRISGNQVSFRKTDSPAALRPLVVVAFVILGLELEYYTCCTFHCCWAVPQLLYIYCLFVVVFETVCYSVAQAIL